MDLQEILSKVITSTNEIFRAEAGSVALLEPAGQTLVVQAAIGMGDGAVRGLRLPVNLGIMGWVAAHSQPALVPDTSRDSRFFDGVDQKSGFCTRSVLCVPLKIHEQTIGVIELMNIHPRYLNEDGLKILSVIADHAALVIENARLVTQTRRQAEEQALLFDNANDLIFTLDNNFKITNANKIALKATGYQLAEVIGRRAVEFISPRQRSQLFGLIKKHLAAESPTEFEIAIESKYQQKILLEVAMRVQRLGVRPVGLHLIARDISQRRKLEDQLRRTEKLSAIGKLVAGVAHELNNPLTAIIGYTSLLQQSDLPENYRPDLQLIYRQADRARLIVRDLLTFARNIELNRHPASLNHIILSSLELVKPQLEERAIEVITALDEHLPTSNIDALQLEQVFLNLITNAAQALTNLPRPGQITITTRQQANTLLATIADNGPGVPPELISRIFDPFFSTKPVGEGTGLGLSICFGIVSAHKGRIWLENASPHGVTFFVELPLVELPPAPTDQPDSQPAPPPPARPLTVLVVDDEEFLLKLLQRVLMRMGHNVDIAISGSAALQQFKVRQYDVVICDILMPDMLGPELYHRANRQYPELTGRFIFITGNTVDHDTLAFLEATATPWLAKPFLPAEIERAVNQIAARFPTSAL